MARIISLGGIVRGAIAGAAGIVAMDLALYARHRATGGTTDLLSWEFAGPSDWESVPAPAQIGRRLYERFLQRPLPAERARLTNNVMHWGYGIGWGAAFGGLGGSRKPTRALAGAAFGAAVWASSYVTLPLAGLYKPIWEYGAAELAPDLAAHLVYGTTTERVFRALS